MKKYALIFISFFLFQCETCDEMDILISNNFSEDVSITIGGRSFSIVGNESKTVSISDPGTVVYYEARWYVNSNELYTKSGEFDFECNSTKSLILNSRSPWRQN